MSNIRPQVSRRNPFWIEKHRYYELKHFSLQYPLWKKAIEAINAFKSSSIIFKNQDGTHTDKTADTAKELAKYEEKIEMVESAAREADPELCDWIIKGVTQGVSYDILQVTHDIPCSKDTYYARYRKYFYLLSGKRS